MALLLYTQSSASPRREAALLALGLGALLLGLLVYAMERNPSPFARSLALPSLGRPGFLGTSADWLPSLLHALAFGLWSAACLPARSVTAELAAGAWGAINMLFEIGQHAAVSPVLAELLSGPGHPSAFSAWLAGYFTQGRFDPLDLAASLAGALMAWALLRWVEQGPGIPDAH